MSGAKEAVVWGTGNVRREFLHVDDMANACLFIMNLPQEGFQKELHSYPKPCFVNVGTGVDVTIRELSETVAGVVGYEGKIVFDATRPGGAPQKLLNVSRLACLGWVSGVALDAGLRDSFGWYLKKCDFRVLCAD